MSTTINTREDLDALEGSKAYDEFMLKLRGSLFSFNIDHDLKTWVISENDQIINRFKFSRSDFEPIVQPDLPVYVPIDNSEQLRKEAMMSGKPYTLNTIEYQVSFTSDDANGMMQVKSAFDMGLTDTVIYFINGTKMPINNIEFGAFAQWFVNERNQFFV